MPFFSYVTGLQTKIPYFNKNTPQQSVACEFRQETVCNQSIWLKLQDYYWDFTEIQQASEKNTSYIFQGMFGKSFGKFPEKRL